MQVRIYNSNSFEDYIDNNELKPTFIKKIDINKESSLEDNIKDLVELKNYDIFIDKRGKEKLEILNIDEEQLGEKMKDIEYEENNDYLVLIKNNKLFLKKCPIRFGNIYIYIILLILFGLLYFFINYKNSLLKEFSVNVPTSINNSI